MVRTYLGTKNKQPNTATVWQRLRLILSKNNNKVKKLTDIEILNPELNNVIINTYKINRLWSYLSKVRSVNKQWLTSHIRVYTACKSNENNKLEFTVFTVFCHCWSAHNNRSMLYKSSVSPPDGNSTVITDV